MARRGGYTRSEPVEWFKTSQQRYAEAITSARDMGQDLTTWLSDAIDHHTYRCELILGRERCRMAAEEAARRRDPSPLEADFMPTRPPPTITRNGTQAAGTGQSPSPRR